MSNTIYFPIISLDLPELTPQEESCQKKSKVSISSLQNKQRTYITQSFKKNPSNVVRIFSKFMIVMSYNKIFEELQLLIANKTFDEQIFERFHFLRANHRGEQRKKLKYSGIKYAKQTNKIEKNSRYHSRWIAVRGAIQMDKTHVHTVLAICDTEILDIKYIAIKLGVISENVTVINYNDILSSKEEDKSVLPYNDDYYDVIIMFQVLHFLPSDIYKELNRVMSPVGKLIIREHDCALDDEILKINIYIEQGCYQLFKEYISYDTFEQKCTPGMWCIQSKESRSKEMEQIFDPIMYDTHFDSSIHRRNIRKDITRDKLDWNEARHIDRFNSPYCTCLQKNKYILCKNVTKCYFAAYAKRLMLP